MLKQPLNIIILVLIMGMISSCYKDEVTDSEKITTSTDPDRVYINKVSGKVLDTDEQPIHNVRVRIGKIEALTNKQGIFTLNEIPFPEEVSGLYLSAKKNGYYATGVRLYPNSTHDIDAEIKLVPKGETHSHNNADGTTIFHDSGLVVNAAPKAFAKNGKPYNGEVLINILWTDPNSITSHRQKVQVYEAELKASNQIVKPEFISMAYIEITDAGGVPLDIEPSLPLKVTFPTYQNPVGQDSETLKETATLLALDQKKGLWVDKGQAQKADGGYDASLNHVTWWSVAQMTESVNLCVTFENSNQPSDHFFTIRTTNGNMIYAAPLSYGSETCIPISAGKPLEIEVFNECFTSVSKFDFQGSTNPLTNITYQVETQATKVISGIITNCAGEANTDSVKVLYGTGVTMDELGTFTSEFELVLGECFNSDRIYITIENTSGTAIVSKEISIREVNSIIDASIRICNDLEPGTSIINGKVIVNTQAQKNKEETLIVVDAGGRTPILIGIDGFSVGTFSGRYVATGDICNANITITKYDDQVGGYIEGRFEVPSNDRNGCDAVSGAFNAKRTR